eukprot:858852-Alexandrium_andersonii.AAC.2
MLLLVTHESPEEVIPRSPTSSLVNFVVHAYGRASALADSRRDSTVTHALPIEHVGHLLSHRAFQPGLALELQTRPEEAAVPARLLAEAAFSTVWNRRTSKTPELQRRAVEVPYEAHRPRRWDPPCWRLRPSLGQAAEDVIQLFEIANTRRSHSIVASK